MITPNDFRTLPASERRNAALRLSIEQGMGLVRVLRHRGHVLVDTRSGLRSLYDWYISAVVQSAVYDATAGGAR